MRRSMNVNAHSALRCRDAEAGRAHRFALRRAAHAQRTGAFSYSPRDIKPMLHSCALRSIPENATGRCAMAFRSGPVHVFVVAPLLLCWGLERLLQTAALGIRIAATAQSVEDALQVIHTVRAHVMVVDDERQLDSSALAQVAAVLPVMLLTSERSDESMLESLAGHVAA